MYVLGDDGCAKLFPGEKNGLTWSKFRKTMFDVPQEHPERRTAPGRGGYIGPVFATSINLTILQLENGTLPIYQR